MSEKEGCYQCGDRGHFARECPKNRKSNDNKCYNCGGVGHISRECPSGQTEEEAIVDLSAINVENLGTLLVPAPSKTLEELSAIAVIKEAIWLDNAQKVIERIKWSAISATKLVTLLRSAKIEGGGNDIFLNLFKKIIHYFLCQFFLLVHFCNQKFCIILWEMDRLVDKYPYKKILYLNWHEAAIGHLLLFKYYVEKYSQNVYFLISEQGVILKATTPDYLKKADDEITKFFTAKIQELELSGSSDFYNNLIQDIKDETDKLKDTRDCPYINLVYSQKLRNSCLAMKKHGYTKPYENWECLERQRKGFCFLIVRPQHRWKEIASNVYELARKRYPNHAKQTTQITWPIEICYEKFIWFYLKQSFRNFKKSLEIKDKKTDKCLTIVVKNDIPELNDLQKQIQSLTFSYRPRRPKILQPNSQNKILILSTLDIERITQLIYHQFGLTSFAKELRRKMSGFLVISSIDISDQLEDIDQSDISEKRSFDLREKQDIICLNNKKVASVFNKLGRRHSIVSYEGCNFVQLKIEKPLKQNYEKILKLRLPCLPRYYFWYQSQKNYFFLRSYFNQKFSSVYQKAKTFEQLSLLYSFICIVEQLHQRSITIGSAINDCVFIDQKRVVVEPDENGNVEEDVEKLKRIVEDYIEQIKQEDVKHEVKSIFNESSRNPFSIVQYLEDYLDSNW